MKLAAERVSEFTVFFFQIYVVQLCRTQSFSRPSVRPHWLTISMEIETVLNSWAICLGELGWRRTAPRNPAVWPRR